MKDKDYIKELFSEKLSGHEVPVRSDLWAGIQSQIGNTAATAAAKGISVAAKWAIGIASSVIVTGTVVWLAAEKSPSVKTEMPASGNVAVQQEIQPERQTGDSDGVIKESIASPEAKTIASDNTRVKSTRDITEERKPEERVPLIVGPAAASNDDQRSNVGSAVSKEPQKRAENDKRDDQKKASGEHQSAAPKEITGKIGEYPNIFTPNNDGVNDFFHLQTSRLKEFSLTILDEKNNIVYTSTDPHFKWDGLDQRTSEAVPAGNYGYIVMAVDDQGNAIRIFKNLQISK